MDRATLKSIGTKAKWYEAQGLVNFGYRHLPFGRYVLMRVSDAVQAGAWLHEISGRITTSTKNPTEEAINIAFSAPGLQRLGVSSEALATFEDSFTEGMVTPHRSRILGDHGPNDPSVWRWGGSSELTPDLLLMLFAKTELDARTLAGTLSAEAKGCIVMTDGIFEATLPINRDHFGFEDGVAQPTVAGSPQSSGKVNDGDIAVGEFLIGHANQRGELVPIPCLGVPQEQNGNEFGRNGTYLVYRQMDQNPELFHQYCSSIDPQNADRIGSQLVGRWPNGTPIVVSPTQPIQNFPVDQRKANEFGYGADPVGASCPLGAHIRRANPRDGLRNPDDTINAAAQEASTSTTSQHRIMRRGRMYGPTWRPSSGLPCPPALRGLNFICLNASIQNQFELIQQNWLSSTKFLGLVDEVDPMVGVGTAKNGACSYTIQRSGQFRNKLENIPRFVEVRGGAYFFLPSVAGIRLLANLGVR
jgi:Dyp-type peroxidase family